MGDRAAVSLSGAEETELLSWLAAGSERHIETACAHIFLRRDIAYKLKRHVDLGYVDFSTLEQRRWALERELEFNRLTAPNIYRAVRTVTREADGKLAIDGAGAIVDHMLEMRRFDETAVLANDPSVIDGAMAEALGRTIAGFHAAAARRPLGGWAAMEWTVNSNAKLLRELVAKLGPEPVERLIAMTRRALERQRPLLQARTAEGFSRRCHGDLHLGNILIEHGTPVLFDCIEFNDLLSDLDIQYDLAFLLMDLGFRGRRDAGVRVLSAWLDAAARRFPPKQVWAGLAALPLMMSVRAAVRAHVCAHSGDAKTARAYLAAATAHLAPVQARLTAVGGLSGSGKSTFARLIAPQLGGSPGAVILRTDEVRKRLAGVEPTARLDAAAYASASQAQVYAAMLETAGALLDAGQSVVLDATFLDPDQRQRAERLAMDCDAPFSGVWLEAPAEVLAQRLAGRRDDASDADVGVLAEQLSRKPGAIHWSRVDASVEATEAAAGWLAR